MRKLISGLTGGRFLENRQVLIFAGLIWIAALAHVMIPSTAGFILLRGILSLMALAWIVSIFRSEYPVLLISPLLVLSVLALVGYSLLESLYAQFSEYFTYIEFEKIADQRTLSYPGSLGETLVLQFVAFGLLTTGLIARWLAFRPAPRDESALSPNWNAVLLIAPAVILAFLVMDVATFKFPEFKNFATTGLGKQLADSGEPLTAFSLVALAYVASRKGGSVTLLFFTVVLAYLALKSWIGLVQVALFIVSAAFALFLLAGRKKPYTVGLSAAALVAVAVIAVLGIAQTRYKVQVSQLGPGANFLQIANFVFSYKVLVRQGQSAYCFNSIVSDHRPASGAERPFYFVSAVVPRFIWKDKPNLSRGHEFAVKYCGSGSLPGKPHYELVTLLAEPVLMGGFVGLAVMQIFLGAGLALVALVMLRGRPVTVITIAALLPWFIHFQQSFALYFANSVKMFIYMLPGMLFLYWWTQRRRADETEVTS